MLQSPPQLTTCITHNLVQTFHSMVLHFEIVLFINKFKVLLLFLVAKEHKDKILLGISQISIRIIISTQLEYQALNKLPVLLKHHGLAHYWTSFDVKYFNVEPLKYKWFYKRLVSVYNWPTTVVSAVSVVSCNKSMVPVKPSSTPAHKKNDILLCLSLDIHNTI